MDSLFPSPVKRLSLTVGLGAAAVLLALSGCGGGSASPPAGGVPSSSPATAASAPAKPSASTAAPAISAGASTSAQPSTAASGGPAASGQTAPGPYKQNGTTTVANGQAAIQATDSLQWQPNTIMAKPGDKVTLTVNDTGNTAHAFLSPALGVNTAVPIANGKSTTVTFTVPNKPGTYQFWCNIPGHAEAGMVGEVIAQ